MHYTDHIYDSYYGGFEGLVTRVPSGNTEFALDDMHTEGVEVDPSDWED